MDGLDLLPENELLQSVKTGCKNILVYRGHLEKEKSYGNACELQRTLADTNGYANELRRRFALLDGDVETPAGWFEPEAIERRADERELARMAEEEQQDGEAA